MTQWQLVRHQHRSVGCLSVALQIRRLLYMAQYVFLSVNFLYNGFSLRGNV